MPSKMLRMAFAMLMTTAFAPFYASAQSDSSSSTKIEDVQPNKNKPAGEDVDELITNARMRAESGSKSKYSIATKFNYNGGTIERPLAEERPNIGAAPGTTDVSQLNGAVSGKYTFDQRHSVMAGAGLRWITPLQGSNLPDKKIYEGNKFDAENPYITGQYLFKSGGVQNALTLTPTFFTNSNLQAKKYLMKTELQNISVYEVGTTGLSLGLASLVAGYAYTENTADQADAKIEFGPYFEYAFNDTFNFRTVFNLWDYHHVRAKNWLTWDHEEIIQSVGLGIAVTRDIFLYPNVQFVLDDIRADRTNVALSTFINVF